MRLLGSLTSPYVRKVRIVLAEKKLDYKLEIDDVWGQREPKDRSNPLGKIPCLIMEDGFSLFDSRVIVEYVDTLSPVGMLIPDKGRARAEVRVWEALADGILDAAVSARLEATWGARSEEQRCQAWIDRQLAKIDSALRSMSERLADHSFCANNQLSLADLSLGCALCYIDFRFPEIEWKHRFINLARLQNHLSNRPSFIDTRPVA
jgi:glutathione S-transferase